MSLAKQEYKEAQTAAAQLARTKLSIDDAVRRLAPQFFTAIYRMGNTIWMAWGEFGDDGSRRTVECPVFTFPK